MQSIQKDPNTGRRRLAVILSWCGVPPDDPLVAEIIGIDSGFKADPAAYENKNPAPGNGTRDGGLESRVENDLPQTARAQQPYRGYVLRTVPAPAPAPAPAQPIIEPIRTPRVPARALALPSDYPPEPGGYKPYYPNKPTSEAYKKGDSIFHPDWGIGTVTKSEFTPEAASRQGLGLRLGYCIEVKFEKKPPGAFRLVGENTVRLLVRPA